MKKIIVLTLALGLFCFSTWPVSAQDQPATQPSAEELEKQKAENAELANRNAQLAAEVRDLKKGVTALEERARSDLGMIASNETFYQVVPPARAGASPGDSSPTDARTRTADAR